MVAATGILLSGIFMENPDHFTVGYQFEPQWDQIMVHGGVAALIVLFSWWWPVFGGIATLIYGSYGIFGNYLNLSSGHDPFSRNLFTVMPEPVYCTLYGILTVGAVIGILAGLKRKTVQSEDTALSERLRGITLINSISLAGAAAVFGCIALVLMLVSSLAADYLIGSVFALVPSFLLLAWITRIWPAQGGLLEIITGIFWIAVATNSSWEPVIFVPYAILCGMLMAGGCVNIARGFITRT